MPIASPGGCSRLTSTGLHGSIERLQGAEGSDLPADCRVSVSRMMRARCPGLLADAVWQPLRAARSTGGPAGHASRRTRRNVRML